MTANCRGDQLRAPRIADRSEPLDPVLPERRERSEEADQ